MEQKNQPFAGDLDKETAKVQKSLSAGAQSGLELAQALERARAAGRALASTSSRIKRVLAGFDQINRLGEEKKTGSGGRKSAKKNQIAVPEVQEEQGPAPLPELEVPKYSAIMDQLFHISDIMACINRIGQLLQQLWQNVLMPFIEWFTGKLVPAFGVLLGQGIEGAIQWIKNLGLQASQLWQNLQAGAEGIRQGILPVLQGLGQGVKSLAEGFFSSCSQIGTQTQQMQERVSTAAGTLRNAISGLQGGWLQNTRAMQSGTSEMSTGVTGALQRITEYLRGSFSQGWSEGFSGLKAPVKGVINSIIGFLNTMLTGLGSALNGVIEAANKLKFTVPDWVPGIGGKQYGFSLKTVSVPKIPYLAQGAVLPANQPFLAVVGDQRHGTNVEAPLSTIQEAVAAVMADHTAGNMAGHEATVQVLNRILEAVLGIELGEAVIARATQSHRMKNAVMKGGSF